MRNRFGMRDDELGESRGRDNDRFQGRGMERQDEQYREHGERGASGDMSYGHRGNYERTLQHGGGQQNQDWGRGMTESDRHGRDEHGWSSSGSFGQRDMQRDQRDYFGGEGGQRGFQGGERGHQGGERGFQGGGWGGERGHQGGYGERGFQGGERGYQGGGWGGERGYQGGYGGERGFQGGGWGGERGFQGGWGGERGFQGGYGGERGYQGGERGFQGGGWGGERGYQGGERGFQGGSWGGERGYQGGGHQEGWGSRFNEYGPRQWGDEGRGWGNRSQNEWRSNERGFGQESRFQGQGMMGGGSSMSKGRPPKGYKRSDDRIREDVCDRISEHPELDASEVEVKVQNGEVILSGTVHERRFKHVLETIAESVSGVSDVRNEIKMQRGESAQHQGQTHGQGLTGSTGSTAQSGTERLSSSLTEQQPKNTESRRNAS